MKKIKLEKSMMHEVEYVKNGKNSYDVMLRGKKIGYVQKNSSAVRDYWYAWTEVSLNVKLMERSHNSIGSNWGSGKIDSTRGNAVYDFFFANGNVKEI